MAVVHIAPGMRDIRVPDALPYRSNLPPGQPGGPGGASGPPLGAWGVHNASASSGTVEIELVQGTAELIRINSGDTYPLGSHVTGIGDGGDIAAADIRLFY